MCTLLLLHRVRTDHGLIVAANRDEYYSRVATGPDVLLRNPRVVGGRDPSGGGTWMGVHSSGFFVGLTNQRTWTMADPSLRSRGEVVLEALRQGTMHGVQSYLRKLNPAEYNPFNLAYGDGDGLEVAYVRPEGIEFVSLSPGFYVLTNDRLGSPDFPKADRAVELVQPFLDASWSALEDALRAALADHTLPAIEQVPAPPEGTLFPHELAHQLQALCVHTAGYGTRSATLAALSRGSMSQYRFAHGAPCTSPFEDQLGLLSENE